MRPTRRESPPAERVFTEWLTDGGKRDTPQDRSLRGIEGWNDVLGVRVLEAVFVDDDAVRDDDKSFVGELSQSALFTPSFEGPNPKRRFSRNNYGDVWVVATAKDAKDKFGRPLVGKAYLVVTVPTYRRWDQTELTR